MLGCGMQGGCAPPSLLPSDLVQDEEVAVGHKRRKGRMRMKKYLLLVLWKQKQKMMTMTPMMMIYYIQCEPVPLLQSSLSLLLVAQCT